MSKIYIHSAEQIVTPIGKKAIKGECMSKLHILQQGAMIIEDGLITHVGTTHELKAITQQMDFDEIIDAKNHIILPGFIDSHTHLVFSGERSKEYISRLQGKSYMEISQEGGGIINTVLATRNTSFDELLNQCIERLNTMLANGVTTVEAKSGYGLDKETELKQLYVLNELANHHPMTVLPTFMGAHAVPFEYKGNSDAYITYLIDDVLPIVVEEKLATFCDIFCEEGIFTVEQSRTMLSKAKMLGLRLKMHADEVVNIGGAKLAADLGAISADHLLKASKENLMLMRDNNVVATVLPLTAFSLNEPFADTEWMMKHGLAVALATDFNPGSCYSENIPMLIALATRKMKMSTEAVITALTLNGAAALGIAETCGSIEVGKKADIVLHHCPNVYFLAYHIGGNDVDLVIKDGNIVLCKQEDLIERKDK